MLKRVFTIVFAGLLCMIFTGCAELFFPYAEESTLCESESQNTVSESSERSDTDFSGTSGDADESETCEHEPADGDLVLVRKYIPGILTDLKYATEDNFTGTVIYEFDEAYLRYGTVKKLKAVCEELSEYGLSLKIWDAFRPVSAQFKLWEAFPDPGFVSDPNVKYSSHSRGNTVDVTVADVWGGEVEMPSGFDDFSELADRDYSDCSASAAANAMLLQEIMEKNGFIGYSKEWWHYTDSDTYPADESFVPPSP